MSPFLRSAALFAFGVLLSGIGNKVVVAIGAVLLVLSFIDAANLLALKWTTAVELDEYAVRIRYGLIHKVRVSLPFSEIRHAVTQKSWLGEQFDYGSLVILAKSEGIRVQYLQDPEFIRARIAVSMAGQLQPDG